MLHVQKLWIEGYVFVFSEEKYFYSVVKQSCDMHGIKIFKCKIRNIINQKRKTNLIIDFAWEEDSKWISKKVLIALDISKVKALVEGTEINCKVFIYINSNKK